MDIPRQVNVNIMELDSIKCNECGSEYWEEAMLIKKIPAVISESGREQISPVPCLLCKGCGMEFTESQKQAAKAAAPSLIV